MPEPARDIAITVIMARKLKVYRTPIGFHDAYVAAPNQKAALKAWGADADLFARGVAEAVTDDAMMKEPLAKPGEVIRRPRGTDAEHMAALPKSQPRARRRPDPVDENEGPPPRRPRAKAMEPRRTGRRATTEKKSIDADADRKKPGSSKPAGCTPAAKKKAAQRKAARPSREKLEAAEAALDRAATEHETAFDAIRREEKALQEKRRALQREHETEIARLEAAIDRERTRYGSALAKWRD
jgi:hypothetical protein